VTFSAPDSSAPDRSAPDRPQNLQPLGLRARQAFALLRERTGLADLGLAVSGGSDSLALLALATEHARAAGYQRLVCATVDHGLRPEAAGEAKRVARVCARLGLEHHTLQWRPAAAGRVTQALARQARHRLLALWAKQQALGAIALGHTQDDRIETFLMRARQGSGWYGLAGPAPFSPSPVWPEGEGVWLMRPLLAFARADLRVLLRAHNLSWTDDPSNANARFERVRMRALSARLSPARRQSIIAMMDRLAGLRASVMAEALRLVETLEADASGAFILPLELRATVSMHAWRRFLEAMIMTAGGTQSAPRTAALERLIGWIDAAHGGQAGGPDGPPALEPEGPLRPSALRRTSLGGAIIGVRAGRHLVFSTAPPRRGRPSPPKQPEDGDPDSRRARARALLAPWDLRLLAV